MIQDVADFFQKQIGGSREIRATSYDMFRHRITARNSTIQNIMVGDVINICKLINKQSSEASGEDVILLEPRPEAIKKYIGGKFFNQFSESRLNQHFTTFMKGAHLPHARVSMTSKTWTKGVNYAIKSTKVQASLMVSSAMVNMSKPYEDKLREGQFNIVLAVFRQCYRYLLTEIRGELKKKAEQVAEAYKRGGLDVKVDTTGMSYLTSEYFLIKGHGLTSEGGTKPDARVKGQQTTTAILDQIDKYDKKMKSLDVDLKSDGTESLFADMDREILEHVMASYRDVLEKHFTLHKFYDASKLEWNENLVIEMEIISRVPTSDGTMQQRTMDPFDYRAVADRLEEETMKVIKKRLSYFAQVWGKMSGSQTREQMMSQAVVNDLIYTLTKLPSKKKKGKGGVDYRLKVNKNLIKKIPKSKKAKAGFTVGKLQKKIKTSAATQYRAKKYKAKGRGRGQGRTAQSPIALRNILNEALPQMVATKMSPPALQFRTGRFANSARVEMVHQGPRGGLQIDYTYMKYPYQTFEPGFAQGSTMRDPRKIIGESIRELATGILGRQPHTIRRT